jgi:hypothetical protein
MQGHLNQDEYNNRNGIANADQLAFENFLDTRRGYLPPGGAASLVSGASPTPPFNYDPEHLDPRYPTQFAGIFKDSLSGPLAPLLRDLPSTAEDDSGDLRRRRVSSSLMRGEGTLDEQETLGPPANQPTTTAMFVRESTQLPNNPYLNRRLNPLMRYQTLMRMPNLVSDNSQTFLIRMTMGFFEVDANNVDSLGAEYRADLGENERYRAMFIIDRSIPVGFVPGQDLNARDVVVFESYDQ